MPSNAELASVPLELIAQSHDCDDEDIVMIATINYSDDFENNDDVYDRYSQRLVQNHHQALNQRAVP